GIQQQAAFFLGGEVDHHRQLLEPCIAQFRPKAESVLLGIVQPTDRLLIVLPAYRLLSGGEEGQSQQQDQSKKGCSHRGSPCIKWQVGNAQILEQSHPSCEVVLHWTLNLWKRLPGPSS